MVEWRQKSKRKKTGGINHSVDAKTKSLSDRGGNFTKTTVSEKDQRYKDTTRGGNSKIKLKNAQFALVSKGNSTRKLKVLDVLENSADKHFVRQKLITKGAIISVDDNGEQVKAKVTSRPGQSGLVNAIIVK